MSNPEPEKRGGYTINYGQLKPTLQLNRELNVVIVRFNIPIVEFGLTADQSEAMAKKLIDAAAMLRGTVN